MKIDHSIPGEYYTQRNNPTDPWGACGPTSAANWLSAARIPVENLSGYALDEYIMRTCRSPEGWAQMAKLEKTDPWIIADPTQTDPLKRYKYPPNQIWMILCWAINRVAGGEVCRIDWSLTLDAFIARLVDEPIIIGGSFTREGHFSCAAGLISTAENADGVNRGNVTHIIVDDSWGNWLTGYQDQRGDSIEIPPSQFLGVVRDYDKHGVIYGFVKV